MFCSKCQAFFQAFLEASYSSANANNDVTWAHHSTILHRSMRELRASSDQLCPVCRSVLSSPTQWELRDLLSNDDEELDIVLEIDAKDGAFPMLFITFNAGKVGRLPKRMLAACDGYLKDDELGAALDNASHLDNSSTGSDAALELASFWLKRCLDHHDNCKHTSSTTTSSWLPTRLIDATNDTIRLIETKEAIKEDDDRRYASLSHCWGRTPIIRTLTANYETHKTSIEPKALSKTFREAIQATRKLGFRYIWIDSLCIIQDSKSDWEAEAATMCDVYRNAILKIAAATGSGGDVGCFQDRDGLIQFPFLIDLPSPSSTTSESDATAIKPRRLVFTSYGRTQQPGGPTVEPPLYGRSWVLQEQLLSPRMLIFDGQQLRWECNTAHGSERTPLSGLSRHIGHQKVIRAGIFNDEEFFSMSDGSSSPDLNARYKLQYWMYTVMDYTHRGMTAPSDRLVAIAGIAQALSRHTKHKYHAGLWSQDFWLGLLWSVSHSNEYTPTTEGAFDLERNKHIRHAELVAPSWSWASVTVPAVYPVPDMLSLLRMCEVLSVSLSPTATAARAPGSLKISGHLRTGYVNAIYPTSHREAAASHPAMTLSTADGRELLTYGGRRFSPRDYFIFSDANPEAAASRISGGQNWRLVRGTFRPDEIIPLNTQITFLAVAQWHVGSDPSSASAARKHRKDDPLQVYTLALVPTGEKEGVYRRVGYAVWDDCAWYGYLCGSMNRVIEREAGWKGMMAGKNLEKMGWGGEEEGREHKHDWIKAGHVPDLKRYGHWVMVGERMVTIV